MAKKNKRRVSATAVELGGVRYVILTEATFQQLCRRAGVVSAEKDTQSDGPQADLSLDRESLAEKLIRRRQASGLSQAELARRADIRGETLNRIERGKTTPDFATVRKLVLAMDAAERELAQRGK